VPVPAAIESLLFLVCVRLGWMNESVPKPCCSCKLGNCSSCKCSKSPGGCIETCKSEACLGRRAKLAKKEPSPAKPVGGLEDGEPRRGADRAARRAGSGSWDEAHEQKAFDAQMDEVEGTGGPNLADAGFKTLRTPCSCPCCDTVLDSDEAALEHFRTEAHSSKMSANLDELGDQIPEEVRSELRATVMFVRPVILTAPVDAFSRLRQAVAAKTVLNASAPPFPNAGLASSHGSTASLSSSTVPKPTTPLAVRKPSSDSGSPATPPRDDTAPPSAQRPSGQTARATPTPKPKAGEPWSFSPPGSQPLLAPVTPARGARPRENDHEMGPPAKRTSNRPSAAEAKRLLEEVLFGTTTHNENNRDQRLNLVTYDTSIHLLSSPDDYDVPVHCVMCNVTCQDRSTSSNHLRGRKHHETLRAEINKREAEEERAAGTFRPTRANLPGNYERGGRGRQGQGRDRPPASPPSQWECVNGQCRRYFNIHAGADRAVCPLCGLDQRIRW